MTEWRDNPAPVIERVFRRIARQGMADLPLANPALRVEAVAFRQHAACWLGVLILPWAMNLLLLPAAHVAGPDSWPAKSAGEKHLWHFPSGDYEFTVAFAEGLGLYHLCSLFSPPAEFADQASARQTACAALAALMREGRHDTPPAHARRAFLGLPGGEKGTAS